MAEYIEREQAYQIAKPIVDYIHSDKYHPVNLGVVIMDMIDDIPAADVIPVEHGHWIVRRGNYNEEFECSVCRHISKDGGNYCGNCGARMDGGKR